MSTLLHLKQQRAQRSNDQQRATHLHAFAAQLHMLRCVHKPQTAKQSKARKSKATKSTSDGKHQMQCGMLCKAWHSLPGKSHWYGTPARHNSNYCNMQCNTHCNTQRRTHCRGQQQRQQQLAPMCSCLVLSPNPNPRHKQTEDALLRCDDVTKHAVHAAALFAQAISVGLHCCCSKPASRCLQQLGQASMLLCMPAQPQPQQTKLRHFD